MAHRHVVTDVKTLVLFYYKHQYMYMTINAAGILIGFVLAVMNGQFPLIEPVSVTLKALRLRADIPELAKMDHLRLSADRFAKLQSMMRVMETAALAEATVEGACSFFVQGFAFMYETDYTDYMTDYGALASTR